MKTRFSTIDICAVLTEINEKLVGMRLANVYDINTKTYLLKLAKPDQKAILLLESGIRLHLSEFDWPKNMMPSGFSMKLRKHLKGRRFVSATQLGIDRIVDMQFGSDEAAYHIILELYDRGNIVLTDHEYTILNILRFRKEKSVQGKVDQTNLTSDENSDVRFAVHEVYPIYSAKQSQPFQEKKIVLEEMIKNSKPDQLVKRLMNPQLPYGTQCIEHCLILCGFSQNVKAGEMDEVDDFITGLLEGQKLFESAMARPSKGYIIQKEERKSDGTYFKSNMEFHPFLFKQHEDSPHIMFDSFNKAVDEFFGGLESQRADLKIIQQEKSAYKKLQNIKHDHEQRLANLEKEQDIDLQKASLIEMNLKTVDQAIRVVRTAIANQIDWVEIWNLIKDAQGNGDPIALSITKLKLETNEITMSFLKVHEDDQEEFPASDVMGHEKKQNSKPLKIDIDLGLTAYSNAKKYYDKKKQAAHKQQKTINSSEKALKSAEIKTAKSLKDAATIHTIQKARKTFWFEKFIWFISSENYLVLGGRDAQQNEILVKKYLTPGDVYVHADLHGATSCLIKNPSTLEVPPKTLNEAGTMAICHSAAWNAKVVTSAWWVHHHQVSKTAPSGEYLTTGSFLIRGKKNYLPPSYLIYGFGILFSVDETCIWKHKDERKVCIPEDGEASSQSESIAEDQEPEVELEIGISDDDGEGDNSEEECEYPVTDNNDAQQVESTEKAIEFPDTDVKLEYLSIISDTEENDDVIYLGDAEPVVWEKRRTAQEFGKSKMSAKQRRDLKKKSQLKATEDNTSLGSQNTQEYGKSLAVKTSTDSGLQGNCQGQIKRGNRSKIKKIKGKYRDQDEEERLLRMEILQQSQSQKALDRKAKKNKTVGAKRGVAESRKPSTRPYKQPNATADDVFRKTKDVAVKKAGDDSDDEKEKILRDEHLTRENVNILSSLTGCPVEDDILHFAIPVCAPYNTMQNYKFKVKLTPGNTKKGKATRSAVTLFMNMRQSTQTEKDHLRSIKDYDLSRNVPGKVKLSAPMLNVQKKKK